MPDILTKEEFFRAYKSGRGDQLLPFKNAGIKYLKNTHHCKDNELLESAVGYEMIDTFEAIDEFDPNRASFPTFLGNKCFAAYQRIRRKEQGDTKGRVNFDNIRESDLKDTYDSPDQNIINTERTEFISETLKKVIQCIHLLSPEKKRAMQLVLREGLTSDDINKLESLRNRRDGGVSQFLSDETGITLENARQLIHRSTLATRELMQRRFSIDAFTVHRNLTQFIVKDEEITEDDIRKLSLEECHLVLAEILSQ